MSEEDDFFAALESEIAASLEAQGGPWAAFIVRALWDYPLGRERTDVLQAVKVDARRRNKNIPATFEQTIQRSFENFNGQSSDFDRQPSDDIFCYPQGKNVGFWSLKRECASQWMKRHGLSVA